MPQMVLSCPCNPRVRIHKFVEDLSNVPCCDDCGKPLVKASEIVPRSHMDSFWNRGKPYVNEHLHTVHEPTIEFRTKSQLRSFCKEKGFDCGAL